MAQNGFIVKNKLSLKQSTVAGDAAGDIRYDASGNLQLRDDSAEKTILDADNAVTVTNKTINADNNTITNIGNDELSSGIDATKIADGSVTDTEFQYIGGLTSDAQAQLDAKALASDLTDHLNDTTDAHDADAISYDNTSSLLLATDVNAAIDEVKAYADAIDGDVQNALSDITQLQTDLGAAEGDIDDLELALPSGDDFLQLQEQGSTPTTPSSGYKKLYAKNDGKLYTLDDAGNEIEVGSGAGGGGVFYVNEDFETGVANLVAYADAAGTSPVDATGGSPNITVSAESASPLIGDQSAQIAKDAANRQGQGVAITSETIDEAYEDKVHTVEFLWKTDANYADGDMSLWVVHPTTGTGEALYFRTALGEYTNELPKSDTTVTRIVSELTPIDATYKIVLHVASTSATAYEVFVDDVKCGPQRTFNAPIVTEWESYTPTVSLSTNATPTGRYRRVGDTLEAEIQVTWSGTTNSATNMTISIPAGLTIDTAKIYTTTNYGIGYGTMFYSGSGGYNARAEYVSTTTIGVRVLDDFGDQLYSSLTNAIPATLNADERLILRYSVPISGWDAGAAFSTTQVDQRTVKVNASATASQALTADTTNLQYETEVTDTHNAWSGTQFTAPVTSTYHVEGAVRTGTSSQKAVSAYVDGSLYRTLNTNAASGVVAKYSGIIPLNKGQVLSFRVDVSETKSASVSFNNWLTIESNPDFTVFGTFPEKNLIQTKTLSANVTTDTTISDLTFSNLTIGKWYEVTGSIYLVTDASASNDSISVTASHNSVTQNVSRVTMTESTDSNFDEFTIPVSFKFQAAATTLTFATSSASASSYVTGNGTRGTTYIQLEERNDLRSTSKF